MISATIATAIFCCINSKISFFYNLSNNLCHIDYLCSLKVRFVFIFVLILPVVNFSISPSGKANPTTKQYKSIRNFVNIQWPMKNCNSLSLRAVFEQFSLMCIYIFQTLKSRDESKNADGYKNCDYMCVYWDESEVFLLLLLSCQAKQDSWCLFCELFFPREEQCATLSPFS